MAYRILTIALLICSALPQKGYARKDPTVSIGLGAHVISTMSQVCETSADVVACSLFIPFAGFDASAHYWLKDWLAIGLRGAGSKDLDASESVSSSGESEDRNRWLWRLSTELKLDSPLMSGGMWFGAELGAAFLLDSLSAYDADGDEVSNYSALQIAPLIGGVLGWDFSLYEEFYLGFDVRMHIVAFGNEPPELQPEVYALELGTIFWMGLGLRFSYNW